METAQSSVITKFSSRSVAETVDRLKTLHRGSGFTLFRVIDHSGTAEGVGVQMPDSKLVMFGNPTKGAAVMPRHRLRRWIFHSRSWSGRTGTEWYRSVTTRRDSWPSSCGIEGALRAPFDAVESIVEEVVGP